MIFDKRKFQVLVDRDHGIQNVNTVSNAYELDPISFIAYKQENDYVVDADKNLIKSLQSNFKFNDEVVNILIEYILDNNNKNLNKNYVEKIAATWKRKGIETAKQAQDEVSRPITKVQSQPKARVEIQSPDYTEAIEVTQESDDENTRIIEAYLKGGQS
nr:DnaD domain protein [Erysipelothrix anatis]